MQITDPNSMQPGGSELTMISLGKKLGTFEILKNQMLYLGGNQAHDGHAGLDKESNWDDLEINVVWGECSVWEVPKGAWEMQNEIEAGALHGKRMRKVVFTKVKGGNHLVSALERLNFTD